MSNEINNLQSLSICQPSVSTGNSTQILHGGEGVVLVGQSCGSIRPSEKAKIGKGAKPPLSQLKKRGVGAGSSKCIPRQPMSLYLGYYAPTVITLAY
jgi:hypothetical protein